jgi:hypothetical protein
MGFLSSDRNNNNNNNNFYYNYRCSTILVFIMHLYRMFRTCKYKRLGILDSVVGIATGYGLDDQGVGVRVPIWSRIFSKSSRPALGPTQPPIQWIPGALSPGVKRPGREADHWPLSSADVKKMWIYTSAPPYPCLFTRTVLLRLLWP